MRSFQETVARVGLFRHIHGKVSRYMTSEIRQAKPPNHNGPYPWIPGTDRETDVPGLFFLFQQYLTLAQGV